MTTSNRSPRGNCCSCGVSVVPSQPSCSSSASRRRKPARLKRGERLCPVLQRHPLWECLRHRPQVLVLLKNAALSQQQECEFRTFCHKKRSSPRVLCPVPGSLPAELSCAGQQEGGGSSRGPKLHPGSRADSTELCSHPSVHQNPPRSKTRSVICCDL